MPFVTCSVRLADAGGVSDVRRVIRRKSQTVSPSVPTLGFERWSSTTETAPMIDLLVRGGLWFTLPLTVLAVVVLAIAAWDGWLILRQNETRRPRRRLLVQLGLFGFVFGLLGHALSLYEMMQAIERIDDVTPALVAGGLRVSLIVPIFGLSVFVGAVLLALCLERTARWHRPDAASAIEDRS